MTDTLAEETQPAPTGPQDTEQGPPPQPVFECAFVVYMDQRGHWQVHNDLEAAGEMSILRQPGVDDYFNACSTVIKDIHVQETAAVAVNMQQNAMMQMAEKARQEQMNQQISQFTGKPGSNIPDLSQLRRP